MSSVVIIFINSMLWLEVNVKQQSGMHKDKERHWQQCTALTTVGSVAALLITYNYFCDLSSNLR
jgi:hypothetical protein